MPEIAIMEKAMLENGTSLSDSERALRLKALEAYLCNTHIEQVLPGFEAQVRRYLLGEIPPRDHNE